MNITKIEVFHTMIPLRKPFKLSKVLGTLTHTQPIVVKIYTDEGIVGLGEADPFVPFTTESPEGVKSFLKEYLGPILLGTDPTNIVRIHEIMDNTLKLNVIAKGAIDMACYDILGKAKGLPIYQILGGYYRDKMHLTWGIGGASPEENVEEVRAIAADRGINTFMLKTGGLSMKEDSARVKAVRKAMPDAHLLVDTNQGWDVATAIRFGKTVEDCNIGFLEQPVPYWDIAGLAEIRASIDIPISIDETLCTIHDAMDVIREGAADVFSVKASKNGGIYKTKEILNLAKAFGIKCWMNSMIEQGITQAALLHLGVSSENLLEIGHCYFSPLRLEDDITTFSEQIKGDVVSINHKTGLGIEIREDILKKYTSDVFTVKS